MIVGVKAAGSKEYFSLLQERLRSPAGFGVTITGKVWHIKGWYVVEAVPALPEFWKFGIVGLAGAWLLNDIIGLWSLFASVPSVIMLATWVFWSRHLYQFIIKKGLRKHYGAAAPVPAFFHGKKLLEMVLDGTT